MLKHINTAKDQTEKIVISCLNKQLRVENGILPQNFAIIFLRIEFQRIMFYNSPAKDEELVRAEVGLPSPSSDDTLFGGG